MYVTNLRFTPITSLKMRLSCTLRHFALLLSLANSSLDPVMPQSLSPRSRDLWKALERECGELTRDAVVIMLIMIKDNDALDMIGV